jgi:hypothetical protein
MIRTSLKDAIDYSTGPKVFKSNDQALANYVTIPLGAAAVAIRRPPRVLVMV